MLILNYGYASGVAGRFIGGFYAPNTNLFLKYASFQNFYCGDSAVLNETDKSAFNNGYRPPYSWVLSPKAGGLSANNAILGVNTFQNLNLAGGLNGESSITGSGSIDTANATMLGFVISSLANSSNLSVDIIGGLNAASVIAGSGDLAGALGSLISILADLNGDGDLTGSIGSALNAVAAMAGSGDLAGAIIGSVQMLSAITGNSAVTGNIIGAWNMGADLVGIGGVVSSLTAIANLISDVISSSALSISQGAIPTNISADISSASTLSPENLAAAVWNSIAASFNLAGTMGNKLNSAGGAANPWDIEIEPGWTAEEILRVIAAVLAGKVSGAGTGTETFRDITDVKDRVTATVDNNGNRTTITLDAT